MCIGYWVLGIGYLDVIHTLENGIFIFSKVISVYSDQEDLKLSV